MCFGENGSDTLHHEEHLRLRAAAARSLPAYRCTLRRNTDGIAWAVLDPWCSDPTSPELAVPASAMPRFTVCRIDPCIIVMVEDGAARRRFSSLRSVEEAVGFMRRTAEAAVAARRNLHAAPALAQ